MARALGTPRPAVGLTAVLLAAAPFAPPASAGRAPEPRPLPLWEAYPIAPKASKLLPASARVQRDAGARSPAAETGSTEFPQTGLVLLIGALAGAVGLSLVGTRRLAVAATRSLRSRRVSHRTAALANLVAERWFLIALWAVAVLAAAAGVTALFILETVRYP